MDFGGMHIAVTGASSGIGLATARMLAGRGARVSMLARRKEVLDEEARRIGAGAAAFAADVGDRAQLEGALDDAAAHFGTIEGLFANAGIGGAFSPITEYADDTFDEVLTVNLKSPFWAIRHVLPPMVERGSGSILVTGSLASKRGMAMNAGYVASKHGVLGLARAVAAEIAGTGVRCNCIVPGFIETPMLDEVPSEQKGKIGARVPQRRMGTPRELAEVAAFLLSDAASHVTGQDWAVDGGVLETIEV